MDKNAVNRCVVFLFGFGNNKIGIEIAVDTFQLFGFQSNRISNHDHVFVKS